MSRERIVAVGLLTDADLTRLGPQFSRAYPVDEVPCFGELLHAIDQADRVLWRQRDLVDERDQEATPPMAPILMSPRQ